jgi:hypothetical protein
MGMTYPDGRSASQTLWASNDGLDWEWLGKPGIPASDTNTTYMNPVLRRPDNADGERVIAPVVIDEAGGGQRVELWSSADGLTWLSDGVVTTYDGTGTEGRLPSFAPSGGFLAAGDDLRLHVSPDAREWAPVDGFEVAGADPDQPGWAQVLGVTGEAAFMADDLDNGDRVLYVLRVEPGRP